MLCRKLPRAAERTGAGLLGNLPARITVRLAALGILVTLAAPQVSRAQLYCDDPLYGCRPDCPGCQSFLGEGAAAMPGMAPGAAQGAEMGQLAPYTSPSGAAPPSSSLAGLPAGYGATGGGYAGTPSMIGDFFGNGYNYQVFNGASVATAGGDRRFKFAENNSPFVLNRVFFTYNHFQNALVDVFGRNQSVDRYLFGIERAFWNQTTSVELRVPFAAGLAATEDLSNMDTTATEFGNMALALKRMLWRSQTSVVSGGLGIVFPTGPDSPVVRGQQVQIDFKNESIHLQPFLAGYFAPHPRSFHLFLSQWDFDATGSNVVVPAGSSLSVTSGMDEVSKLTDQTLWYLDYAFGYWVTRNPNARFVRGVAPMVELHYTTTLQNQDYGSYAGRGIFVEDLRRDVLNMTGGVFIQLGRLTAMKVGGTAPVRTIGRDKLFDGEFAVQLVRLY